MWLRRILLPLLLMPGCTPAAPHPRAEDLALHWAVLDNHQDDGNSFRSALTLTNHGEVPLGAEGWTLYFNFGRHILPDRLPRGIAVTRINGDFFRLTPDSTFAPLPPGASRTYVLEAQNWAIKVSEAPEGFYVVFTDAAGRSEPPAPVADVTVAPFVTKQQTDRMPGDALPVPTPATRYARNAPAVPEAEAGRITPTPVHLAAGAGAVTLTAASVIHYAPGLAAEAAYLVDALEPLLGVRLGTAEAATPGAVTLQTGTVTVDGRNRASGDEAYRLHVDTDRGITITGTDPAGVFYGIQSLRAWLPVPAYAAPRPALTVDAVTVEDAPRFGYRGLMLDVARNFQTKETVLKLLDLMAFYKLNKFHFHLTDDEGWRVEIDGLPELTAVGGRRGHTTDERDHLVPSFGSGPDPDAFPGSGFYTRADFVEILRYAGARHIEVIPEVDVPGHARAAIRAMAARHAAGDDAFLLSDPADASVYTSVQGWNDNVVNVCRPSTYRFLETVVAAFEAMYAEAGVPLTTFHTGGDEVPHGAWAGSPDCAALIRDVDGVEGLPAYFLGRMVDLLAARGLVTAGWDDIGLVRVTRDGRTRRVPNPAFRDRNVRLYVWNNVWGWGEEENAYQLANAGYPVVLSNATNLYFDLAYDKDPEEPGYYWAGFVDTRKAFSFDPFDLYQSADVDGMGRPLDPAVLYRDATRLTEAGRRNILGMQGQIWGENARGAARLEYFAFPRMLGLAERAWAPARPPMTSDARERALTAEWRRFATRLGHRELPRLDRLYGGVGYRLPPPGGIIADGLLKANVAFPGLTIRYTTDGTEPTASSPRYTGPVAVGDTVRVRTFDTRGRGSRTSVVAPAG